MDLGKLQRRLTVRGRGEAPAVVRTWGDDGVLDALTSEAPAARVRDEELPPLRVVERPDDAGAASGD